MTIKIESSKPNAISANEIPIGTIFTGITSGSERLRVWIKAQRFGNEPFLIPLTGDLTSTYFAGVDNTLDPLIISEYTPFNLIVEN